MHKKFQAFLNAAFFLFLSFSPGCEQDHAVRRYEEVIISPHGDLSGDQADLPSMGSVEGLDEQTRMMVESSMADIGLLWDAPPGWIEERGAGMRMATFKTQDNLPVTCTIISLGGMAGGLKFNVERWLGQLSLEIASSDELDTFLDNQEHFVSSGDLPVTVIDFTQYPGKRPANADSMMAAIVNVHDKSIFVKMTGTVSAVQKHSQEFRNLCISLKLRAD